MDKVKTNSHGTNSEIKANILSDDKMRKLGFTDYSEEHWYYYENVYNDVSFNLTIDKNNPNNLSIDVLDENFCQPYDYQRILDINPNSKPALEVQGRVEAIMYNLMGAGVISGHKYGEYI